MENKTCSNPKTRIAVEHPPFVDQKTSEKPGMDFHSHGIPSYSQTQGTVVGRRQHQLNQHARGEHHLSTSWRNAWWPEKWCVETCYGRISRPTPSTMPLRLEWILPKLVTYGALGPPNMIFVGFDSLWFTEYYSCISHNSNTSREWCQITNLYITIINQPWINHESTINQP